MTRLRLTTPSARRRWAILGVLCLSVFLAVVDNTIVNVALPRMSEQLHASNSQLQWIVDAYSLAFAGLLLIGGSLGDRFGRKGALSLGIFAFAGFSVFAGLSGSVHMLIGARALMGLAAAFIFPATLAILTNTFRDPKERATAIGIWTGVVGLAVALGPLTGGALLQHFWWGSIFFVNLPVAAIAVGLGRLAHPEQQGPRRPPPGPARVPAVRRRHRHHRLHHHRGARAGLEQPAHGGRIRLRSQRAGRVRAVGAAHRPAHARRHPVSRTSISAPPASRSRCRSSPCSGSSS